MKKLIKFERPGCSPCGDVDFYLEMLGVDSKVEKINPFENTEMMDKYKIQSVPVTILVDAEGTELGRSTGYRPEELDELVSKLN